MTFVQDHESKLEAEGAFVDWLKQRGMQTLQLVGVAVNGMRSRSEKGDVPLSAASSSSLVSFCCACTCFASLEQCRLLCCQLCRRQSD